jgi:DivIVA domain-containing protein
MTEHPGPDAVSAELIANRGFTVSRRGFEQEEVRAFLELVAGAVRALKARSLELEAEAAASREAAKNPELDEDTLMRLVGEETGAILRSARAASVEMRAKAEAQSNELVSRVERETGDLRAAAESETASLRDTVERETAELRARATHETTELRARVERETAILRETAERETAILRETAERETAELRAAAEADTAAQRQAAASETAILRETAQRETAELRARAESEAARVVDEARQQAGDLRTEAEEVVGRAEADAEQAATRIRTAAQESADQLVGRARREADALHQQAEHDRRLTVEGAQAVREKILGDLTRRRRVAAIQIEQLRAGRERLLQSYAVVRRTLEEVNDELHRADAEAREAAADAGRRLEEGAEGDDIDLAAELTDDLLPPTVGRSETTVDAADESGEDGAQGRPDGDVEAAAHGKDTGSGDAGDAWGAGEAETAAGVVVAEEAPGAPAIGEPADGEPADGEPADGESVEVAPGAPGVADVAVMSGVRGATDGGETTATATGSQEGPGESGGGVAVVDDLFARIRAGRQDAVNPDPPVSDLARGGGGAVAVATEHVVTDPWATGLAASERPAPAREDDEEDDLEPKRSYEEESWLQLRDSALGETETALTRKLKRALQDEQNDLLDRLRLVRGRPTADTVLSSSAEQKARYAGAASPLIERGAQEGVDFALLVLGDLGSKVGPPGRPARVDDLVTELTDGIVDPLRRRLAQTIEESGDDEQSVLVEALGAAYREWKTQRIERLAGDVLAGAFARGSVHATPRQGTLRWVVDDVDGPCPDCDDNVLAGTLPPTEAFPTGQLHPPAHAGCRCIVVPGLS